MYLVAWRFLKPLICQTVMLAKLSHYKVYYIVQCRYMYMYMYIQRNNLATMLSQPSDNVLDK